MKKPPRKSKSFVGASVRYCGHHGCFVADLVQIGTAVVVRANGPVTMNNLNRTDSEFDAATHQMEDFPGQVFWRPDLGVFVVPEQNITVLRDTR